jgi:hypothetical protein
VTIARVSISTSSPRFMLSDPLARVQIVANVQGGRLGDATALRDLLPAGTIQLTSDGEGRFDGDAAAEIRRHVARGAGSIRTHGIGFAAKKIHAIGDVAFVANVADWNLARRTLTGDVRVVAENVTGGFDPNAPAPEMIAGRIVARVSARELDLSHPELRAGDFALEVDRARLPDARALNAFLPSPRILAIESGSALVSAKIDTARTDHAGEADLRVWLPGASIRFHETRLAGDVLVDVKARAPLDHAPSEIDLEGSQVAMRNVRVTDSATDTAAWSGDFVLQEGSLRLDPTPRFAGSLSLRARDASPLLAILLRGTLPNLLAKLTRMPELTAATDFVVEPDALVVTNLLASGADLSVLGTYALRGDERSAAFVVQKGPWSVGVRLDDAGTHVRFFGLNRWYAEQRNEALRLVTFRVPR